MSTVTFKRIATNVKAGWEEILNCWLLIRFGEHVFPGISNAEVEFWASCPPHKSEKDLEGEGVVLVGKRYTPAMVAKKLGLDEYPVLKELFESAVKQDADHPGSKFDLRGMAELMYETGRSDDDVLRWTIEALDAIYVDAMGYFDGAYADSFNARSYKIEAGKQPSMLTVGVSDSPMYAQFAFSPYGARAGAVVQQKSNGSTLIHIRNASGIEIKEVAKLVRVEEMKASRRIPSGDWRAYVAEGVHDGWDLFPEAGVLINDSESDTRTLTKLPLEKIEELVQIGANPSAFERLRGDQCRRGCCSSTPDNPCSWDDWKLQRCHAIRQKMAAAKKSAPPRHTDRRFAAGSNR